MSPRWLFLDLDGTIADSLSGIRSSIHSAFASIGKPVPIPDLRRLIGPNIRTILRCIDPAITALELDQAEKFYRQSYDTVGCLEATLFPDVSETLSRLSLSGVQLFVVTNKPRRPTLALLEQMHIVSRFREVITRDSVEPPYDSKGMMIEDLIVRYGVDRKDACMVGDTVEDKEAAEAVHIGFIHAAYGYGGRQTRDEDTIHRFSALLELYEN